MSRWLALTNCSSYVVVVESFDYTQNKEGEEPVSRDFQGLADQAVGAYRAGEEDLFWQNVRELRSRFNGHHRAGVRSHQLLVEAGLGSAIALRMADRAVGMGDKLSSYYRLLKRFAPLEAPRILVESFANEAVKADLMTRSRLYKLACRHVDHRLVKAAFIAAGCQLVACKRCRLPGREDYPPNAVIVPWSHLGAVLASLGQLTVA